MIIMYHCKSQYLKQLLIFFFGISLPVLLFISSSSHCLEHFLDSLLCCLGNLIKDLSTDPRSPHTIVEQKRYLNTQQHNYPQYIHIHHTDMTQPVLPIPQASIFCTRQNRKTYTYSVAHSYLVIPTI